MTDASVPRSASDSLNMSSISDFTGVEHSLLPMLFLLKVSSP